LKKERGRGRRWRLYLDIFPRADWEGEVLTLLEMLQFIFSVFLFRFLIIPTAFSYHAKPDGLCSCFKNPASEAGKWRPSMKLEVLHFMS